MSSHRYAGLRCTPKTSRVEIGSSCAFRASAGTPAKSELVKTFLKWKLPPALFLCGLPGDLGGGVDITAGVVENIKPREFVEIVDWVEILRDDQFIRLES